MHEINQSHNGRPYLILLTTTTGFNILTTAIHIGSPATAVSFSAAAAAALAVVVVSAVPECYFILLSGCLYAQCCLFRICDCVFVRVCEFFFIVFLCVYCTAISLNTRL